MKTAKVLKIIDSNTIVINIGENNNVKVGDLYLVFEMGEELFATDTNESLGKLEIVKGKGEVTHVQEKISTIKSVAERKDKQYKRVTKPNIFNSLEDETVIEETFEITKLPFDNPKLNDSVKEINNLLMN